MKTQSAIRNPQSAIRNGRPHWSLALAALALATAPCAAWQLATNLTLNADASAKVGYDSNVYLQDVEPDLATYPRAALPFQESFVLSLTPRLTLNWKASRAFQFAFGYAPDIVRYTEAPGEDYVAHRWSLNWNGKVGRVNWECPNSVTWIDGSGQGLFFGGPGGPPSIGGIPLRDRRASVVVRDMIRTIHNWGNWLFRPTASAYIHDFMTEKHEPVGAYKGYQNYVDRNDVNGGFDLGYKVAPETYLVLGWRVGRQEERPLPWSPYECSNQYGRLLPGLEGKPLKWLKLSLSAGPDYRDWEKHIPPGHPDHAVYVYVDSSVTIVPDPDDSITLTFKRLLQPAFGAPSMYEDIVYDLLWKHSFDKRWAATAGFRAYAGQWIPPVLRDDWIYTPSASVSYAIDSHWSAELSYSYDFTQSRVPNTAAREFTRHLVWLGAKYTF